MKKIVLLFAIICLFVSCSTTKKIPVSPIAQNNVSLESKIDESLYDHAIVILEKKESVGVPAEYAWLKKNYPGYKRNGQILIFHNKKPYDILKIITAEGVEKTFYFDISNFFGKN